MILQHWLLLCGCWQDPYRSLSKAVKVIAKQAYNPAGALAKGKISRLIEVISTIVDCLSVTGRMYKRKTDPSPYQLLLELNDE